jgi:two-component system NtrC family sensor kinase
MKSIHKYFTNSFFLFSLAIVAISLLSLIVYGRGVYQSSEQRLENIASQYELQTTNGIRNARNNLLVAETVLKEFVMKDKVIDKDYVGTILASAIYYNKTQKDLYFAVAEKYLNGLPGKPPGQIVFATRKMADLKAGFGKVLDFDSSFIKNYDIQVDTRDIYLKDKNEIWYRHPVMNKGLLTYVPPYYDNTYIKEWLITLGRAVYDQNNDLVGVVAVDYVIGNLKELFEKLINDWGVIFFQSTDGKILFDIQSKEGGIVTQTEGFKETITTYLGSIQNLINSEEKIQHKKIGDQWFVYRITHLKNFPWMIMVYRPLTAFYAPIIPFATMLFGFVLCTLIGFIFYLKQIQNRFLPAINNFLKALKHDVKLVKENKTISGKYDESNIIELSEIIRGMNQLFEVVNENFINYQIELEKNIKIKNDLETLVVKKSEQLIQKEKMAALGVMTAGIAHEIKNPLNLICNTAEIISLQLEKIEISGLVNDKDIVERFEKIKNSNKILTANGKRVDNIIRTLLMQTRTGNSSEHQKIVLDEIIKTSLDFILVINRPKINNQINISFQKPDDKIFILANPINLGRVFINIFDNSIYAITKKLRQTAYNAEIKIEVSVIYNMVEIRIRDNGVGMNKDQLKNALTPFYTTKPAGEGSGLGLSFAYDNIRDLGGNLEIVSEENEFTEIIISLPLKEDA